MTFPRPKLFWQDDWVGASPKAFEVLPVVSPRRDKPWPNTSLMHKSNKSCPVQSEKTGEVLWHTVTGVEILGISQRTTHFRCQLSSHSDSWVLAFKWWKHNQSLWDSHLLDVSRIYQGTENQLNLLYPFENVFLACFFIMHPISLNTIWKLYLLKHSQRITAWWIIHFISPEFINFEVFLHLNNMASECYRFYATLQHHSCRLQPKT